VLWIARREPRSDRHRGCCDQTISLAERDPPTGEVPSPAPGTFALDPPEGRKMESSQKSKDARFFLDVRASQHLVHVDGAYPRDFSGVQRLLYPLGNGTQAQRVDQNGGVEQQRQSSADTARVTEALVMDPSSRIGIPIVTLIGEDPQTRFDVFAAPCIVERSAQGLADECAATAPAHVLVELFDEIVIEAYVQSHGHSITHTGAPV
jgi:hypothetical protein